MAQAVRFFLARSGQQTSLLHPIMKALLYFFSAIAAGVLSLTAAERPNIVFIFSDDHALEAISAYGDRYDDVAPTPNIDRIANEGMLFERSYCGNAICGPSRATILTGKHSHQNGFMDNNFSRFDGTQPTFPKMLQGAGYETALIGKWHLKSDPTGFDYWEILPGQGSYFNPDFIQMDGTTKRFEGYCTDIVVDKSIEWIKNRKDKSKPFVLMSQQKAPHRHWFPPVRHFDLFDDVKIPEPETLFDDYANRSETLKKQQMSIAKDFSWGEDMFIHGEKGDPRFSHLFGGNKGFIGEYRRMNDEQKKAFDAAYVGENDELREQLKKGMSDDDLTRWKYQRYIKNYLRCIRALDENIGRLLKHLDDAGLAENTIVIYSSDQGFYLGEHGWYDKRWMFEESLSMPFVIRWPKVIKPGIRSKAMIQNIDYAPTFLDICGAPIPEDIQGKSIVPVLKNQGEATDDWREAVYYQYSGEWTHRVAKHDGVRTERYKLMHLPNTEEWMLFDLKKDPQELNSVATDPAYADVLAKMMQVYGELREQYEVNPSTYPSHRWNQKWWKQRWDQQKKNMGTSEAKNAKVVFIGDSITQGWEGKGKAEWEKHFAPLGALNWGYSGDRTEHVIWRLQNGDVQRVSPEVAVLMIGTNNTGHGLRPAEETAQGIQKILDDLAWKWPETKVVLTSIFPRGPTPDDPKRLRNDEINKLIKPMADGKRVIWQDISAKFLDDEGNLSKEVMPDRLHLNESSYGIWAEAVAAKLKELGVE